MKGAEECLGWGACLRVVPAGGSQVRQQLLALSLAKETVQHHHMRIIQPHACTCQQRISTCSFLKIVSLSMMSMVAQPEQTPRSYGEQMCQCAPSGEAGEGTSCASMRTFSVICASPGDQSLSCVSSNLKGTPAPPAPNGLP